MRPVTSPRPSYVAENTAEAHKRHALTVLRRLSVRNNYCKAWKDTGQIGVPGWVLGELLASGEIEHRKRAGDAPNEWRSL